MKNKFFLIVLCILVMTSCCSNSIIFTNQDFIKIKYKDSKYSLVFNKIRNFYITNMSEYDTDNSGHTLWVNMYLNKKVYLTIHTGNSIRNNFNLQSYIYSYCISHKFLNEDDFSLSINILNNKSNIKFASAQYYLETSQGIEINKQNRVILFVLDNKYFKIHISKNNYKPEDDKIFEDILNNISIEEIL